METVPTKRILEIDEVLDAIVRAGDCRLRSADDRVPLPFKADTLLRIVREVPEDRRQMALMEKELSEVSGAIGSVRWMDPPDGGDVSMAEQVRRMRADLEAAEAKLITQTAALKGLDDYWTADFPAGPDGPRTTFSGFGEVSEDTMQVWRNVRAAL